MNVEGKIACMRAEGTPAVPAEQRLCHICQAAVWVSMSMVAHVDNGELTPTCLDCLPGVLQTDHDYEFMVHPDQHEELAALQSTDYTQQLLTWLNQQQRRDT